VSAASRSRLAGFGAALLAAAALAAGCARATTPPVEVFAAPGFGSEPLRTLAVLPAELAPAAPEEAAAAIAGVTEMTVREASRVERWRVVEPEAVEGGERARDAAALAAGAGEAAARSEADAALVVVVVRWREREGSDYGVAEPASVALRMILVPRGGAEAVWKADYAFTQEPLAYNLWNLWGVIRGGPKWMTAGELARIGIAEAVSRLAGATR
jgi:hypothetical protein